ncbi:Polypyrimidine tract-binding protein-like protein 3 [Diplonema papillatum]|nr:Polypyrimidine tract-binding protein-like protein 3 [Diplonema papillatum]
MMASGNYAGAQPMLQDGYVVHHHDRHHHHNHQLAQHQSHHQTHHHLHHHHHHPQGVYAGCGPPAHGMHVHSPQQQHHPRAPNIPPQNGRVLLVVLRNLTNAVELDAMFSLFSQFGTVEKLSTFVQHQQHQLVVQFQTPDHANTAMSYLNGRDWELPEYHVKCTLAIVPSRLPQLSFKKDDGRNKDYTSSNARLEEVMILYHHHQVRTLCFMSELRGVGGLI